MFESESQNLIMSESLNLWICESQNLWISESQNLRITESEITTVRILEWACESPNTRVSECYNLMFACGFVCEWPKAMFIAVLYLICFWATTVWYRLGQSPTAPMGPTDPDRLVPSGTVWDLKKEPTAPMGPLLVPSGTVWELKEPTAPMGPLGCG